MGPKTVTFVSNRQNILFMHPQGTKRKQQFVLWFQKLVYFPCAKTRMVRAKKISHASTVRPYRQSAALSHVLTFSRTIKHNGHIAIRSYTVNPKSRLGGRQENSMSFISNVHKGTQ